MQVYASSASKPETETEQFYQQVREVLHLFKPQDINRVMGNFNLKVGSGTVESVIGAFGLGDSNENGKMLVQFCREENLVIKDTFHKLLLSPTHEQTSAQITIP